MRTPILGPFYMSLLKLLGAIILITECYATRFSNADSSASRQHLVTFNVTHRKLAPRRYERLYTSGMGSRRQVEGSRTRRIKARKSQGVVRKDLDKALNSWQRACIREEQEINSNHTLWKEDLYALQGCDVLNFSNASSTQATTPQLAEIIAFDYGFHKPRATPAGKGSARYCEPGDSKFRVDDVCRKASDGNDIKSDTLPFCSHLTMSQVLQSSSDIGEGCAEFNRKDSKDFLTACQTCTKAILRMDKLARIGYCALEGIMSQADCETPYSTQFQPPSPTEANCDTCKKSYRLWLCSQFFEKLHFPNVEKLRMKIKPEVEQLMLEKQKTKGMLYYYPCPRMCHSVMKMCPSWSPVWDRPPMRFPHLKEYQIEEDDAVEYPGWSAFHCPDGPEGDDKKNKENVCFSYEIPEKKDDEPKLQFHKTQNAASLGLRRQTAFHIVVIFSLFLFS